MLRRVELVDARRLRCMVVASLGMALVVLSGCVATPKIPEAALRLQESTIDIRTIQSRSFAAPSETIILAAAVAVLQDMEYNLDSIEKPLGVLSASKVSDADSTSEKTGLFLLDVLCAAGGTPCNNMANASDKQKTCRNPGGPPESGYEGRICRPGHDSAYRFQQATAGYPDRARC
jgi:hypothetical protein